MSSRKLSNKAATASRTASGLKESDLRKLEVESWISSELAVEAGLYRVSGSQGRELLGAKGEYAGVVFPYFWPGETKESRGIRLRLDKPALSDESKPGPKYLAPRGQVNMLYVYRHTNEIALDRIQIPIAIVEGEKKTLALERLSRYKLSKGKSQRFAAVGIGGVWNWKTRTGPDGERLTSSRPIPDLDRIRWVGRTVYIVFDADVTQNKNVEAARKGLSVELQRRGAKVLWVHLPQVDGAKGVDDLLTLESWGPKRVWELFKKAVPSNATETFRWTQLGNAKRLVAEHGANFHYVPEWKSPIVWNGTRWVIDQHIAMERLAKETVRNLYRQAAKITDDKRRADFLRFCKSSESRGHRESMVKDTYSEPGVAVSLDQLDANPWRFNVRNCTIDLKSRKRVKHCREDLFTQLAPVKWVRDAECARWLKFLNQIFDGNEELIAYVRRAIGYSLTGDVGEKAVFVLYGGGNNGKTTLLETIRHVLGDYAGQIRINTLMTKRSDESASHRSDIADLKGKRFVTSSEVDHGQRLSEAQLKYLTGMGRIKTNRMRKDGFEFDPQFKIFLDCNHKPIVRGTDNGIWNRIHLIPFEVEIPSEEIDTSLPRKLRAEASGILRWALKGFADWRENGLNVPQTVKEATAGYRCEMDVVGRFLEECCDINGSLKTKTSNLYLAYSSWCDQNGHHPMSNNAFGRELTRRGFEQKKSSGRWWVGIGLKTDS